MSENNELDIIETEETNLEYIVPNRAVPLKIVESAPINENWKKIQDALNKNYELASQVNNKLDATELGASGGIATLDLNNKLNTSQLPEQAKGHVFETRSLAEQLALNAYTGDICVRLDIGKTYALGVDSPSMFSSWIEIASVNSISEIIGNACYSSTIKIDDWEEHNPNNDFCLFINATEHGQGNTKYLLVLIKNKYNQDVKCDYIVSEEGLVTIYSEFPFDGCITISNLSGNSSNLKYIPYSIISGYEQNGVSAFISHSLHSVFLNTLPNLVVIDGFDIIRTIAVDVETEIPYDLEDSRNILFVDSANITNDSLDKLTYINSNKYLGVVKELPTIAERGDRCYLAYHRSYEYTKDGWTPKAFVPVGEFTIKDSVVINSISYPFMSNGVDVKFDGHELDRLYGPRVDGLELIIDEYVHIGTGSCLVQDKLVQLNTNIVKNYKLEWAEGNAQGSLDVANNEIEELVYEVISNSQIYYTDEIGDINSYADIGAEIFLDSDLQQPYKEAEENEFLYTGNTITHKHLNSGWANIFLIASKMTNKLDVIISFNEVPTLPVGYDIFRRIGHMYREETGNVVKVKQFDNIIYFVEPLTIDSKTSSGKSDLILDLPHTNSRILLNYKLDESQNVRFYVEDIKVMEKHSKNDTITLSYRNNIFSFNSDEEADITFEILGYYDERELV